MFQHVGHRIVLLDVRRLREQVNDDFGVGGGLKNMPVLLVLWRRSAALIRFPL